MNITMMECPKCKGECELLIKAEREFLVCVYCRSEVMLEKSIKSRMQNVLTIRKLLFFAIFSVVGLTAILSLIALPMLVFQGEDSASYHKILSSINQNNDGNNGTVNSTVVNNYSYSESSVVIRVGDQTITARELEIVEKLHDFGFYIFNLSWHVYYELAEMLIFQYAKELGLDATLDEARRAKERWLRDFPDHALGMEPNDAEYWERVILRQYQNDFTIVNLYEYYDDLDYRALSNLLVREWIIENPEIAARFRLEEVMAALPERDMQFISLEDLDWNAFGEGAASDIYEIIIEEENERGFDTFYFIENENLEQILIWLYENQESLSTDWRGSSFVVIIYFECSTRKATLYVHELSHTEIISILSDESGWH